MNYLEMYQAIQNFKSTSMPSNADSSAPCSNGDIRKVVENLSTLLTGLVSEMEQSE